MSELEEKLGSILSNPQMMQQIMGMASLLSNSQEQSSAAKEPQPAVSPESQKKGSTSPQPEKAQSQSPQIPQIDPGMLQNLAGLVNQGGIDRNQMGLLKALQPYLSRDRITRLERAMHAARMANAATTFLNSGGLQLLTRR